jgi:hypothetical protein
MIKSRTAAIRAAFSGLSAKEMVASIIRHHRIQASPGYRDAANLLLRELQQAGLRATIERYPADYNSSFWNSPSFQEWDAQAASLHLVEPVEEARKLADFRELKLSLIQRSAPFKGNAQVVVVEDGTKPADYAGKDVAGKLILCSGEVEQVRQLAVDQFGAIGILFDGMREEPPIRRSMELPDARQYSSFWWTGLPEETSCFGFVLSPREGEWLRRLIQQRERDGLPPVTVSVDIDARFYPGEIELVEATIGGRLESEECVLIVSHLCHPQPSANDNATGAAANFEAARTLRRLIDAGELPRPQRDIRFLWMPEMTGSYAYLARHEDEISGMVAGLNLDMVGADQSLTGSVLLLERPPDAAASFAPDLLERLREELFDDAHMLSGLGTFPLFRYATTGFSGGSDHFIFSDPSVGVPMPMLIQWPDKFYHTSADTLDKVDPGSLARSGVLAAVYAHFVADAGEAETTWLAHEMLSRFQIRLARIVQSAITEQIELETSNASGRLIRRSTYQLERFKVALSTLGRLWPGIGPTADTIYHDAKRYIDLALVRASARLGPDAMERELDGWEQKASQFIPVRHYRGPGISIGSMATLTPAQRQAWREFCAGRRGASTIQVMAEYWADGERSGLEIIELVEMETGVRDAEMVVRTFELLRTLGLITYRVNPAEDER